MKIYSPTTPSRRFITGIDYSKILTENEPHKKLTKGFKKAKGRNVFGRVTSRGRGGGVKKLYREIDFRMDKINQPARLLSVEYDPNRSGFIGLVEYQDDKEKRYLLLPREVKTGEEILTSPTAPLKPGNRLLLKNIPTGAKIYNIEIKPGGGAKMVRSAGSFAEVLSHEEGFALIKLPSKEIRKIDDKGFASIGQVSNPEHRFVVIGKAGRNRLMGRRPIVRGSAQYPASHKYGGGEGRAPRGTKRPKTKWGKITGGRKTRKPKKYSDLFIVERRKK
ncbi:MAG: 50S ribosomal protein L2 [Candidatus Niyogibacteria bacterium RIFCSPLOWO2_12_FULL_41_13]|uniref:50S ribosomal protein L2 n=1 Tax=Candidatus Niyogibacteria bacterium RIFCSPLOWO2_12_FULL_41_13 TaxID=1801726 RepID=A0A1G2F2K5_9BACT|nr:MAG: 50S ribosomal protein L2 [Candidatus Niyogibacteria bacterium RIFCSPLOWO2_12_FULL_41_13]